EERVEIINGLPHEKILGLLEKSDLYLYPGIIDPAGRAETQGLANLEAMAQGLPIIASRVGGVPDYVIDGETGFLCEPGNIEEFVERLQWIIGSYNSDEITEVRRRAVRMVSQNYCQEELNNKLLNVLLD